MEPSALQAKLTGWWKLGIAKVVPSRWLDSFVTKPVVGEQICTDCGAMGAPVRQKHGRDDLEAALWLLLVAFFVAYFATNVIHHASWHWVRFPFPGMIVRFFSMLTKLFLLLAPVYTIWRVSTEYQACAKCQHPAMIPLDTPRGQQVRSQHHPDRR